MENLNDAQRRAVMHRDGHLLIIAGPGTGKTHTLTNRIVSSIPLLKEGEKILAVTFTNKASREMRERLAQLNAEFDHYVEVGTFHSFCLQLLRAYKAHTNLPEHFRVASPEEIGPLLKSVWDLSARELKDVLEEISRWKSFGRGQSRPQRLKEYNDILRGQGLVDFDDLLNESLILLKNNERVAAVIRRLYRFICVDEYQDVNAIQNAFLKELTYDGVCLTAIGDPDQAIYGFRGSDVQFFHQFDRDFPQATVMMLRENYRSTENLLEASAQVIQAPGDRTGSLKALAKIHAQGKLIIHESLTDKAEAEYVVRQIEQLMDGTSMFSRDSGRVAENSGARYSFADIAILFRLNAQKNILKQAFERSGMPYQMSADDALRLPAQAVLALRECAAQDEGAFEALKNFEKSESGREYFEQHKELAHHWPVLLKSAKSFSSLQEFLDQLALQQPEDNFEYNVEKVALMSLHASKGLEFPVVFIVGCEEQLLPLDLAGMSSTPDEERRLFYVGMTRAKEQLYLTHARRRLLFGQSLENPATRFLSDIKEDLKAYDHVQAKSRRESKKEDDRQLTLF